MTNLSKTNCTLMQSEKGNLYITHPDHKVNLRFYADVEEIKKDEDWRERVSVRSGDDDSYYGVLAKSKLEVLEF